MFGLFRKKGGTTVQQEPPNFGFTCGEVRPQVGPSNYSEEAARSRAADLSLALTDWEARPDSEKRDRKLAELRSELAHFNRLIRFMSGA
jgi:hypothetical protein